MKALGISVLFYTLCVSIDRPLMEQEPKERRMDDKVKLALMEIVDGSQI
jgi:hypothetical protein